MWLRKIYPLKIEVNINEFSKIKKKISENVINAEKNI